MIDCSAADITDEQIHTYFERTKNWGQWGRDDERGTLNYLTDTLRTKAAQDVRLGKAVSCARDFPVTPGPTNPTPALHHMVIGGDDPCGSGVPGMEVSTDFIGIMFHGLASTHIDALCHSFVDGIMYNGHPAMDVKSTGATRNSIHRLADGVFGRGVLLDIPQSLGIDHVPSTKFVTVDDLQLAEGTSGVTVSEGDLLLIRTGRDQRDAGLAPTDPQRGELAGLHPECVEWFHERKIAVLGSDAVHDPMPPGQLSKEWPIPIHMCALAGMGLHLMDNLYLEDLAETCRREQRHDFLFTFAPLRIAGGTGSPINPLAVF